MTTRGERGNYLSLALDARRAINAILAVERRDGDLAEMRDSISAAAVSLSTLSSHGDIYAKHGPASYSRYEEIQTLRETSSAFELQSLIPSLQSLLSNAKPSSADLSVARKFFRVLESRALHHYNDPGSLDLIA